MPSFCDDADTDKLLEIVAWNLTRFFGYESDAAAQLVSSFYSTFDSSWGDDFYHHEGPWRCAALMHYSALQEGDWEFDGFLDWAIAEGHNNPPTESFEYFRKQYFDAP